MNLIKRNCMGIENFTALQIILLILTAFLATLLAWLIVRFIYRKSHKEFDAFDKE